MNCYSKAGAIYLVLTRIDKRNAVDVMGARKSDHSLYHKPCWIYMDLSSSSWSRCRPRRTTAVLGRCWPRRLDADHCTAVLHEQLCGTYETQDVYPRSVSQSFVTLSIGKASFS